MARPAKSVKVMSKNLSKEEKQKRLEVERKLKGNTDLIVAPNHLNENQKLIFNNIVNELEASGILGNIDIYILTTCSIALDRIQTIETMINDNPELMTDTDLRLANDKYMKDFFRCCNELSLSPQSRAKIGNIAYNNEKEKQDPLLKALKGGSS